MAGTSSFSVENPRAASRRRTSSLYRTADKPRTAKLRACRFDTPPTLRVREIGAPISKRQNQVPSSSRTGRNSLMLTLSSERLETRICSAITSTKVTDREAGGGRLAYPSSCNSPIACWSFPNTACALPDPVAIGRLRCLLRAGCRTCPAFGASAACPGGRETSGGGRAERATVRAAAHGTSRNHSSRGVSPERLSPLNPRPRHAPCVPSGATSD